MMKSCYIHIPFCEKICSYCDFCKMYYNEKWVDAYLEELEKEMKKKYQNEVLETIYIGGGTPSCLSIQQLEKLFQITSILQKKKHYEFTMEANFESITKEKLELMKKSGVNRLSFGLESTNQKHLALLERTISKKKAKEVLVTARALGFTNINIDLMYALPEETTEELEQDLEFVFSLQPEHISCYSLMIEPHTKLGIHHTESIEEDLDAQMYQLLCQKMKRQGFVHYEISNYAKKGYESKHNLTYWNNLEYYGFGLGASSYINKTRYTNTKSFTNYLKGKYLSYSEKIEEEDNLFYDIMLKLRTKRGINLEKLEEKYHVKIEITSLLEQKLLKKSRKFISIPEDKWYISNEIILRFQEGVVKNEEGRSI